MKFFGRIFRKGNRVHAECDNCLWTTMSTGPKAELRVLKHVMTHDCSPAMMAFYGMGKD